MINIFQFPYIAKNVHPNYLSLHNSPFHQPARDYINNIYNRMGDPNGQFIKYFQGNGFHARVFELAVYEYLIRSGFTVDHSHAQPDFIATKDGSVICIEATTSNIADGNDQDISALHTKLLFDDDLQEKVYREFPKRMLSCLSKKTKKKYHTLTQCKGKPLVVALAPYFEPGSVTLTDGSLVYALYGVGETYGPPISKIPFFTPRERNN
ncbi:hypothetical protein [Acidithiobacillus ferriphilus]|uniref:hypothetical protein n=1 Tax=Acidithiobacillus ferriphilus TaxID=1689834 RepID=UPI002DB846D3|nr:hypothetical protein [Acidithiobacillus ferriphilus]MEB8535975.1 hypothetical protein [Acidithiobacillus ferriphilus]